MSQELDPQRRQILAQIETIARSLRPDPTPAPLPNLSIPHDLRNLESQQRLREDLGLDSIEILTLAVEVEDLFEIRLDDLDEGAIVTVGELIDVIVARVEGRAGGGPQ